MREVPVGQVPIAPVAALIRQWGARNGIVTHMGSGWREHEAWVGHLASLASISERTVARIVNDGFIPHRDGTKREWITFDLADRILVAMDYMMEWHTNEDLTPHYGPLPVSRPELEKGYEIPEGFRPPYWQKALIRRWELRQLREAA